MTAQQIPTIQLRNLSVTTPKLASDLTLQGATTLNGNLIFSGATRRIQADFTDNTHINRTLFQTSIANGNTILGIVPNGTGTISNLNLYSASDPTNAAGVQIGVTAASTVYINSLQWGTGTYLPLVFNVGGAERMRIQTDGVVTFGSSQQGRLLVYGPTSMVAVEARASHIQSVAGLNNHITANAYYDGTNWLRVNTANPAAYIGITNANMTFSTTAAGTGTIAWTVRLTSDVNNLSIVGGCIVSSHVYARGGNVYMGASDNASLSWNGGGVACSQYLMAPNFYASGGAYYLDTSGSYYINKNGAIMQCANLNVLSWGWIGFAANSGINLSWDGTGIASTHRLSATYHSSPAGYMLRCADSTNNSIYMDPANNLLQFNVTGGTGAALYRFYSTTSGMYFDLNLYTAYGSAGWTGRFSQNIVAPQFQPANNSNGWLSHSTRSGASSNELSITAHLYLIGTLYYGVLSQNSTVRSKKNIRSVSPYEALNLVTDRGVEPIRFERPYELPEGTRRATSDMVGFTAEAMVDAVPEVVNVDDEGLPEGIDYSALVPVLWGAVQALNQRITELEGRA